jgi:hypothetical protein
LPAPYAHPVIVALAVLCAVVVTAVLTYAVAGQHRAPPPRELLPSSPEYRNHQAMARWIERRLDDEMVRPLLGEADQSEARRLLTDFYGEER